MTYPPLDQVDVLLLLPALGFFAWLIAGLAALGKWLVGVGATIVKVIAYIWPMIKVLASKLWTGVNFVRQAVWGLGRRIASGVTWLVQHGIPAAIDKVKAGFEWLNIQARRFLQPVADWIKRIKGWFDWFYRNILEPLFKWMDFASGFFRFLDRLGVDWAGRIAAAIDRVRTEIYNRFTTIREYVDEAGRWVNELMDAKGLIKRRILMLSLFRDALGLWAIFVNTGLLRNAGQRQRELEGKYPRPVLEDAVTQYRADATLDLPEVKRALAFYRAAFRRE